MASSIGTSESNCLCVAANIRLFVATSGTTVAGNLAESAPSIVAVEARTFATCSDAAVASIFFRW